MRIFLVFVGMVVSLCFAPIVAKSAVPAFDQELVYSPWDEFEILGATRPSLGYMDDGWGGLTLGVIYLDGSGDAMLQSLWDPFSPPVEPVKNPQLFKEIRQCVWGGSNLIYCQVVQDIPPFLFDLNLIYAWDLELDQEFAVAVPDEYGEVEISAIRDAYEGHLLLESSQGHVGVVQRTGATTLRFLQVVGGVSAGAAGQSRSPAIGIHDGLIHVVYQDFDDGTLRWSLNSWALGGQYPNGQLVATIEVGLDAPNPSDLKQTAYLNGGSPTTILAWKPAEFEDEGQPPEPYPIVGTVLDPSIHSCGTLHDLRMGEQFALLRGEECSSTQDETRLYVVTVRNGMYIVEEDDQYQPFHILLNDNSLGAYDVLGEWIVFEDDGNIRVLRPDSNWLQRVVPWSPGARTLAPWNLRATGSGEVDYQGGQTHHDWHVHLSKGQIYRIVATSGAGCVNWYHEMYVYITGGGLARTVSDDETGVMPEPRCPAIDVGPFLENTTLNLKINRFERGAPGFEPPLIYQLEIVPL